MRVDFYISVVGSMCLVHALVTQTVREMDYSGFRTGIIDTLLVWLHEV